MTNAPAVRRIRWKSATRIVASRFPPVDLFERVSPDPAVWDALIAAEMLVNPRIRDAIGDIRLVPPEERVTGPGAIWVMAPFAYVNPRGSRFSDGSYGVYYAGNDLSTAVAETAFHFARFARESGDGARHEPMRVMVGTIDASLHDLESLNAAARRPLLDPHSYVASRPYGSMLRTAGSNGIHYPSVRNPQGHCVAAFRPTVVGIPRPGRHLLYDWDGARVRRYFDYQGGAWIALDV